MRWELPHLIICCRPRQWVMIASLVIAAARALALDPAEKPANYIAAHWDTEDGLPHNWIRCIFQTRDGYLWVGTQQGLARFDGLTFTIFNPHNTPALPNNLITSFAETRDGSLWIGTSVGLSRYKDGRFTAYGRDDGIKADTVNTLCVAPDGSLWIGSREGITRWADGKFINDIDTSAYDMKGMRFVGVDRHNTVWISAGFDALRYSAGKFIHYGREEGLPAQMLRMFQEDADGTMMAGTYGGLMRLRDGRFVPFEQNHALSSQSVDAALVDHAGNLWIASLGGLDRYAGGKIIPYTDRNGDKLGVVSVLFEDREHCLWVGTSTGLYRLTDRRASLLPLEDGATRTLVSTLLQGRDGSLWIGKWNKGVDHIQNGITTHYKPGAPLSPDPVTAIYEAPDGTMWFGNRGSSLDRLEGNKVTTFVYQSGVVSSRPVTAIYQDPDGEFLVGISRRGLLRLSEGRLAAVPEANEFAGDTVWTIKRTRAGRLLMGTDKGLYQRSTDRTWKQVALTGRKPAVGARALLEDEEGVIWIATEGDGLVRWHKGREQTYTSREGMVDDVLFSVLDDHHGSLWVNSARGIARIRKSAFAQVDRGDSASLNGLTFGRADGLLSASSSGIGAPSALCLTDGSIMAATDEGAVLIDQRRVQINTQPPPVVIESVVVDDQPLAYLRELSVPAGAYRLEIRYSALSLVAPEKLRFRYRLEGSDPVWIEAGYQRRASYTHLSPGRYTFRVLACNNDGVWNETGDSLAIQIQPHFYQTKSFMGLAVTFMAAMIFAVYQARKRSARRQMAVLESLVEDRTCELKSAKESAEAAVLDRNNFIAALTEAKIEQEDLHKQLLVTSRRAGMAEVATNVLHNVGNVLNSVNISASLVIDNLKKSKVSSLVKVAGLLHEHERDLGTFFTSDTRGRQLPSYLTQLSEHLLADQKTTVHELASLVKNVEHIKEIVAMQQDYARVSGVLEIINVRDLVEDGLRMNVGALGRHGVEVVREYEDVPAINIDKHKVLQILVNLLRNAKHACQASERADRQITVRVALRAGGVSEPANNGHGRIQIFVTDNGVGIPPENLIRIFNHGFTTRKDGHGFGLHSGALAAREMGGSLSVRSEGQHCGATFILELPVNPLEKS